MASLSKSRPVRVTMMGLGLNTTTGIATVVKNWLSVGYGQQVKFRYISTNQSQVPGQRLRKLCESLWAYGRLIALTPWTDVVHLHLAMQGSFWRKVFPFWWSKSTGRKVILHLHGSNTKDYYAEGSSLRKFFMRKMFERADVVMVLSRQWKDWVASICQRTPQVEIVLNTAPQREPVERKGRKYCTITLMGRLGQRKGTWDLLQSFALLTPQFPYLRLCLPGDGDLDRARDMVSQLGLEEKVEIPGWVSGSAQDAIWDKTDICCLPSYNEGLPGSVLEGMSAGLPVVSTPVGGIAEAVLDGETGFLVEPGDVQALTGALESLVTDEGLRGTMGEAGRAHLLKKFDLQTIVDQVVKIQESLLVYK
jgi:glycosyltransferase involved in cell wall biosynthesis